VLLFQIFCTFIIRKHFSTYMHACGCFHHRLFCFEIWIKGGTRESLLFYLLHNFGYLMNNDLLVLKGQCQLLWTIRTLFPSTNKIADLINFLTIRRFFSQFSKLYFRTILSFTNM
jgi:hypothetical protein